MLAILQFVSPLISVIISAWGQHIPFLSFSALLFKNASALTLFKIFGLPLLAGYAIWSVKRWSYPVFLTVMGWVMVDNVMVAMASRESFGVFTLSMVYVANFMTVGYFLIPAVSAAYFNPRLRWWESKPRYRVNLNGDVTFTHGQERCLISDISVGGVMIQLSKSPSLKLGDMAAVRFGLFNLSLDIQGRVVHCISRGTFHAYGIKLENLSPVQKKQVTSLVTALKLLNFRERQDRISAMADFQNWISELFSGKGWVPNVPKAPTLANVTPLRLEHRAESDSNRDSGRNDDQSKAA